VACLRGEQFKGEEYATVAHLREGAAIVDVVIAEGADG
jgi:uncharacterized protein (DUF1330 family)